MDEDDFSLSASGGVLGASAGDAFDDFDGFGDDDLDGFGDGVALADSHDGLARAASFECLDEAALVARATGLIGKVREVCGVGSAAVAAALLRAHDWSAERVVERWMDDSARVLSAAGVSAGDLEEPAKASRKKFECPICMETVSGKLAYALACGHRYCGDCWSAYLRTALESAHTAAATRCPWPDCKRIVLDDAFRAHLSAAEFARYEDFVQRSFVDANPKAKWCPAPGCHSALCVDVASRRSAVTCACGARWCYRCADASIGDHAPASCEDVEKWMAKASDESENLTWLAANTKQCPKCRSPIEKNGGCMHMTCTKAGCRHEFCWLCRGPWKDHGSATGGYYKCNKFEKNKDAVAEAEAQRNAQTELEHYMFYYHRYESHHSARKVADEQRRQCAEKEQAVLAKFGVRSADTKFMLAAAEELLHCRRVLEFSYVYGFYLSQRPGAERNLFEYLQEDVEKHTNELSEQYERELSALTDYAAFIAWKERVTNLTRVCQKFVINFSEGVERGLTAQQS